MTGPKCLIKDKYRKRTEKLFSLYNEDRLRTARAVTLTKKYVNLKWIYLLIPSYSKHTYNSYTPLPNAYLYLMPN